MNLEGNTRQAYSRPKGTYRIAMISGDGIGNEVIPAAARVLDGMGLALSFEWLEAGWDAFSRYGTALPEVTVEKISQCDGALFGAVSSPSTRVPGYSSPILELRKRLDLYGNLRPAVSTPLSGSRPGIDLLIVRENTEDLYVKQEQIDAEGKRAVAQRVITQRASSRIARLAFEQARLRAEARTDARSPRVTIVHKANVLPITDGLFRETCLEVAAEFPDVECEEQLVDSMAYRLIREPERYDVVVAPNLYGDILSDEAAALVGGVRPCTLGKRWGRFRACRACPWQRPGHRRHGNREPARRHSVRDHAAAIPGRIRQVGPVGTRSAGGAAPRDRDT